ncbi:response regulator transcription factor [Dyadobacter sp. CY312]|uniref:DNA-binding response regulator n=1 Tax=Dyadobacter sp. CY312 TaxID=2907303 RepID=UPI001F398A97|nr:response regulator transcription factor [Dyadobacter sp. CY312]MCE7042703.1 response regulator transcription factor [Dyadobacter sp. CY312]
MSGNYTDKNEFLKGKSKIMIKVGLIEKFPAICIGLQIFLEQQAEKISVVYSSQIRDIVSSHSVEKLDVIILGLYESSEDSHLAKISLCKKYFPSVPVVVYADIANAAFILESLKLGLMGLVLKEDGLDEVAHCIKAVVEGKHYLNSFATELLLNHFSQSGKARASNFVALSEKERIVAEHLVNGMRPGEIARELNLRPSTVSTFKRTIFKKTRVENIINLKTFLEFDVS